MATSRTVDSLTDGRKTDRTGTSDSARYRGFTGAAAKFPSDLSAHFCRLWGTIYLSHDAPEPSTKRQKYAILSLILSEGVQFDFSRSRPKVGHGPGQRWPVSDDGPAGHFDEIGRHLPIKTDGFGIYSHAFEGFGDSHPQGARSSLQAHRRARAVHRGTVPESRNFQHNRPIADISPAASP